MVYFQFYFIFVLQNRYCLFVKTILFIQCCIVVFFLKTKKKKIPIQRSLTCIYLLSDSGEKVKSKHQYGGNNKNNDPILRIYRFYSIFRYRNCCGINRKNPLLNFTSLIYFVKQQTCCMQTCLFGV